jgi:hypothetical protein
LRLNQARNQYQEQRQHVEIIADREPLAGSTTAIRFEILSNRFLSADKQDEVKSGTIQVDRQALIASPFEAPLGDR